MRLILKPAFLLLLWVFTFILIFPSFAYQKVELDVGVLGFDASIATRRLAYQQDKFYFIQQEIGSLLFSSNDSWQLAGTYKINQNYVSCEVYAGLAGTKSLPTESIAICPALYLNKPSLSSFWGEWGLQSELYLFSDAVTYWIYFNDTVKIGDFKVRVSPLMLFGSLRYQSFKTMLKYGMSIGINYEF